MGPNVEATSPPLVPVGIDLGSLHARVALCDPATLSSVAGTQPPATSSSSSARRPTPLPSVVSNAQGGRYTLALSTEERHRHSFDEDGEGEGDDDRTSKPTFIFGEAAKRSLLRGPKPPRPPADSSKGVNDDVGALVRTLSTLSLAGSAPDTQPDSDSDASLGEFNLGAADGFDADPAAAAFFAHLAELACDACGGHPGQLRCVVSVPPNASREVVEGVVRTCESGLKEAVAAAAASGGGGGGGKKKKGKKKDDEQEESAVIGVISDPAAVCLAHGLTDPVSSTVSLAAGPASDGDGGDDAMDATNENESANGGGDDGSQWENVLVVDWGASGLTATHLRRLPTTSILSTVRTRSDPSCSGKALVRTLVQHCASHFERKNRISPPGVVLNSIKARHKLTDACENAVRTLSRANTVTVSVDGLYDGLDLTVPVSRPRFDMLVGPLVRKAEAVLRSMVTVDGTEDGPTIRFDYVLAAGNASDMPAAQTMLRTKLFPHAKKGRDDVPPDEAVALGCALHAGALLGCQTHSKSVFRRGGVNQEEGTDDQKGGGKYHYVKDGPTKRNVELSPVSVGVCRLIEGEAEKTVTLIGRGAPLPSNVTRTVELGEASAAAASDAALGIVQIVGSEGETNKLLGKVEGIPPGATSVELTLELDRDGSLTVAVNGGAPVSL